MHLMGGKICIFPKILTGSLIGVWWAGVVDIFFTSDLKI